MVSALRNTTICPPTSAGFGENDCAPSRRVMVMVMALVVDVPVPGFTEVGDDGIELPPPPQLAAVAQTAASAATLSGVRMLVPPVCLQTLPRSARGTALSEQGGYHQQ